MPQALGAALSEASTYFIATRILEVTSPAFVGIVIELLTTAEPASPISKTNSPASEKSPSSFKSIQIRQYSL